MGIVGWIVLGLLVGAIARALVPRAGDRRTAARSRPVIGIDISHGGTFGCYL